MSAVSRIEWTESTWNPITGCTRISLGCKNCYAMRMAKRLQAMGQEKYRNGCKVTMHPDVLEEPFGWKKPRMVFVNSMSDLFHDKISNRFIERAFEIMESSPQHIFQVLTKRSERLARMGKHLKWSDNIWMGVTVESNSYLNRISDLRGTGAAVKWLSLEPLLGPLPDLNLEGIDWVVVGGESGPGARPMKEEWVSEIFELCEDSDIAFFFKQWGGINKKKNGRLLKGRTWDELPVAVFNHNHISF